MNKLRKLWLDLNSSLWFLPGLIVAGSIASAIVLVDFDKQIGGNWISGYPRIFGIEPSGSRDMLAAVASSMITIAGIVFSIVIVALSLASTQYTPRILRNFMRDQINQVVLGVFVGIFTYCIVVFANDSRRRRKCFRAVNRRYRRRSARARRHRFFNFFSFTTPPFPFRLLQ